MCQVKRMTVELLVMLRRVRTYSSTGGDGGGIGATSALCDGAARGKGQKAR